MASIPDYRRPFCERAIALNLGLAMNSASMEEVRRLAFHASLPNAELLPEQLAAARDMVKYHEHVWDALIVEGEELLGLRASHPEPSLTELVADREGMTVERAGLAIAAFIEERTRQPRDGREDSDSESQL